MSSLFEVWISIQNRINEYEARIYRETECLADNISLDEMFRLKVNISYLKGYCDALRYVYDLVSGLVDSEMKEGGE